MYHTKTIKTQAELNPEIRDVHGHDGSQTRTKTTYPRNHTHSGAQHRHIHTEANTIRLNWETDRQGNCQTKLWATLQKSNRASSNCHDSHQEWIQITQPLTLDCTVDLPQKFLTIWQGSYKISFRSYFDNALTTGVHFLRRETRVCLVKFMLT